jgi:hypothetical protein
MASRCSGCSGPLVEITLTMDGEPVTMRSCSSCDRRSWHRGGHQVELTGLIGGLPAQRRRR